MAKATYENIRRLCSGVFSRKQTLQFAPATTASCDEGPEGGGINPISQPKFCPNPMSQPDFLAKSQSQR